MKGYFIKKRTISIYVILAIIANMFSPFGTFLNTSYAANPEDEPYNQDTLDAVEKIEIEAPTINRFDYGDTVALENALNEGVIKITYESGAEVENEKITTSMIKDTSGNVLSITPSKEEYELAGSNEITKTYTIRYEKDDKFGEAQYNVTIVNAIDKVEFKETPKSSYLVGEEMQDIKLLVTRKAGNTEELTITKDDVDKVNGFDTSQVTETAKEVTVIYGKDKDGNNLTTTFTINVSTATVINDVSAITLVGTPKTDYKYGENLDITGLTLTVTSSSGITTGVPVTSNMVGGYNPTILGNQEVTISYGGQTASYTVNIDDFLNNIDLTRPNKVTYKLNETPLDLTGAAITEVSASGVKGKQVQVTSGMVSEFDSSTEGPKTITVTYTSDNSKNFTKKFTVVVDALTRVLVKNFPNYKALYGDELDLTGATIEVELENGEKVELPITKDMVIGYNTKPSSRNFEDDDEYTQIISIDYTEDDVTETMLFPVVTKDYFDKIQLNGFKDNYKYGEDLDVSGATVSKVSASGVISNVVALTRGMISEFNAKKLGEQVLTVMYAGKTTSKVVTVADEIIGISINNAPDKTEYDFGTELSLSGAKLNVYKLSGTEVIDITSNMISGYNQNEAGVQHITVSYAGYEAEFTVTVKEEVKTTDIDTPGIGDDNSTIDDNTPSSNDNIGGTDSDTISTAIDSNTIRKPIQTRTMARTAVVPVHTTNEKLVKKVEKSETDDKKNTKETREEKETKETKETKEKNSTKDIKKSEHSEEKDNENVYIVKFVVGMIALSGLLMLIVLLKNKANVGIYVLEEDGEMELVGKDRITKENTEINLESYIQENKEHALEVVLSKHISKKLDGRMVTLKIEGNKVKNEKIVFEDGEFSIIIKKSNDTVYLE